MLANFYDGRAINAHRQLRRNIQGLDKEIQKQPDRTHLMRRHIARVAQPTGIKLFTIPHALHQINESRVCAQVREHRLDMQERHKA